MQETLAQWIEGFEKEIQTRFNPALKVLVFKADPHLDMELVAKVVAGAASVPFEDLLKPGRCKEPVTDARMLAMYYIKTRLKYSYHQIARYFGNRHHSTAINAIQTITGRIEHNDEKIMNIVNAISDSIEQLIYKIRHNGNTSV